MELHEIAKICHEVNKAYCESLGDMSQPSWDDAPDWQRESAMNGVLFHIQNPNVGPDASHANWLAEKMANGWKFGIEKDAELKQHPCMVDFLELPPEQRAKDHIFQQIVHSLKDFVVITTKQIGS